MILNGHHRTAWKNNSQFVYLLSLCLLRWSEFDTPEHLHFFWYVPRKWSHKPVLWPQTNLSLLFPVEWIGCRIQLQFVTNWQRFIRSAIWAYTTLANRSHKNRYRGLTETTIPGKNCGQDWLSIMPPPTYYFMACLPPSLLPGRRRSYIDGHWIIVMTNKLPVVPIAIKMYTFGQKLHSNRSWFWIVWIIYIKLYPAVSKLKAHPTSTQGMMTKRRIPGA